MAVLTRFLLGLFNGLHGPSKARCFSSMGWRMSWIPLLHFHQLDLCSYIIEVELNYVHTNRRNNLFFIYSIHFKQLLICLAFIICGCVVIGEFVAFLWFFCDLRILLQFCRFFVIWGFFSDLRICYDWWVLGYFQICYCDLQVCCDLLIFYCDCKFVMICGFVSSLTWLILMLQAYVSEVSNANHQALGVSIVWSLFLYSFLLVFVGSWQLLLNYEQ
jgi:hypothetical protein